MKKGTVKRNVKGVTLDKETSSSSSLGSGEESEDDDSFAGKKKKAFWEYDHTCLCASLPPSCNKMKV